ncbi:glycosyltransferase family 2 protein [Clostridium sp. C2-6-12]|uniref:glycosyltransferase family 2 protein n=1 Tax=Clostridium sp. C2-6-12 TaxID=2698832 RepID=UPI00325FCD00
MKVSIIIPNYNGKCYLDICIESIYKQSFDDYEIIIVDNNSIDGSYEYIKNKYKDIKIIRLEKNYGFSKAVNEGIKASKSDYVVLLNNDTEVKEEWLLSLVSCIEKDTKIFSCCSKMIRYNEKDRIDDAGDEYTIFGWAYKCGDGASINKFTKDREVFSCCAGAAIYRRDIFNKIGYFDESFFAYMEDVDMSYRARIYGYKNVYAGRAQVYHIGSATSGSRYNIFKVRLAVRNNIYVILKNMPFLQIIVNIPFLVLGFFIKYLFFLKKGMGKEYSQGFIEGIKSKKKIEKVKYSNRNIINYIIIQLNLIVNTIKLIMLKF